MIALLQSMPSADYLHRRLEFERLIPESCVSIIPTPLGQLRLAVGRTPDRRVAFDEDTGGMHRFCQPSSPGLDAPMPCEGGPGCAAAHGDPSASPVETPSSLWAKRAGIVALLSFTLQAAAAPLARDSERGRTWAVASGPARDIRFEALTRADGIPSDRAYQVLQDRRGFTWFTTLEGLVRHDGYQHVRYPGIPLTGSTVTANRLPGRLYEDRNGTLWVATDVLTRFDPSLGRFTAVLNPRGGPARPGVDRITAVRDGPHGSLWVGVSSFDQSAEISEPVLYEVNPATGVSVPHRMDPGVTRGRPVSIRAIEEDKRGRLWLGTSIGLVRFDPRAGSFRAYDHTHTGNRPSPMAFSTLAWDSSGHLWIRMPAGIERFDPETEVFDRFVATRLWNMLADAGGRIWLWGGTAGLEVFDPSSPPETALRTVSYRAPGSPLQEVAIPMLESDRQGNIWAFLFPAFTLHRYSPRAGKFGRHLAALNEPDSLRGVMVRGFVENSDGSIWIASYAGLSLFDPRTGGFTSFGSDSRNPHRLPSDHLTSIYKDRSNTLWVATDVDSLGRFDRQTGRYASLPLKRWSAWAIQLFFEDSRGRFWAGDQMGTVRLVDRQTGEVTQQVAGHVVHEDREGNVWFGAPPGLHKLDRAGRSRSVPLLEDISGNPLSLPIVRSIHEDSSGILWLASTAGLFRFDPRSERVQRFSTSEGLASRNLGCLLPDEDGNLWMSSDRGISRFDPRIGRFYNYDERDGLQGNVFYPRSCHRARDGRLYFGGNLGFNAFYPRDVLSLPPDPPVILTSLQIRDKEAPVLDTGAVRLNHRQNGLSFEFAVPAAASPWKLRYRFRLEGMEQRWIETDSAHRTVRYTDIPPGDYVFRAEASTDGRSWDPKGVALRVTITPPWWRTWWAESLAALLVAGLLMGAYQLRVAALHTRQQELTALVDRRTSELASARDQAEAANRAKSAFLANISHELRTPLNAILGFSNLLRESGLSGERSQHVNIINRSGEHLLTLIDEVLDLAKIEAGQQSLTVAPCDLICLVNEVVEMMRVRANEKNLELVWERSPDYPKFVRLDAPKLRQVLINLLGNAVKFTEEGTVTLRSSSLDADDAALRLRFEVEDTGAGIAVEDRKRIFEPFVQAPRSGLQKGTGLGLTITRRFVEMMGGTMGLESESGRGSRFTVEFPVELAGESEVPNRPKDEGQRFVLEPGQPECRVLVVDDNAENTMVLEQMLGHAGFRVQVAQDGALGVQQFQQWRPHFIWMDVRMPVMDGMEAARRIRELDGGPEVKIAAMTASAFQSERNAVMATGMDDFIGKPYRWQEVFECMGRHLGVRYLQQPVAATAAVEEAGLLRPVALAALPHELRRELMDAVLSLDPRRIGSVIDRVRELDKTLASSLSWFGDRFNYTAILNAMEGLEIEPSRASRPGREIR